MSAVVVKTADGAALVLTLVSAKACTGLIAADNDDQTVAAIVLLPQSHYTAATVDPVAGATPGAGTEVCLSFDAGGEFSREGPVTTPTFLVCYARADERLALFLRALDRALAEAAQCPPTPEATTAWLQMIGSGAGGVLPSDPGAAAAAAAAAVAAAAIESDVEEFVKAQHGGGVPRSVAQLKERWVRHQMETRAKEFTMYSPLHIFLGTYNVNGKYPKNDAGEPLDLRPWLGSFSPPPDVYAIGFQELDLSAEAFVFNNSTLEEDWSRCIEHSFPRNVVYTKLKSKQLVGMLLLVYVQQGIATRASDVRAEAQGTGIMGVMGNKGGVSIRFQIDDSTFCVTNSHLAAHDDAVARRNQDHHEIIRRSLFQAGPATTQTACSLFQHDHFFWVGDLNYRIPLPDAEVKQLARAGKYDKLLAADQLTVERAAGRTFVGFEEPPIAFPPTYKYDPGTDNYDSSEKLRTPAWCDRVLRYTREDGDAAVSVLYTSFMDVRVSDHKPVASVWRLQAKTIDHPRRREVLQAVIRTLDTLENKSLPDVVMSANQFSFGDVRYQVPVHRTLTIQNVSQVPAQFQFVPKNDETAACKPWLHVEPSAGAVQPGDAVTVHLVVEVDPLSAQALNTGAERLDDILILHLVNGKDYFVSVSGTYLRSCFCTPLDDLVFATTPLRTIGPAHISRVNVERMHVPKEVWLLVDHLVNFGLQTNGLFMATSPPSVLQSIRELLDTGAAFPADTNVCAAAELLVEFLEVLPDPLVSFGLYTRCLECSHSYILCRSVVAQLSASCQCLFLYLTAFLREVLRHAPRNRLSAEKLAFLFGTVVLRPKPSVGRDTYTTIDTAAAKERAAFVYHFLVNDERAP